MMLLTTRDKPRLLDLFCGAGGAAVGYHRAGFEVVGVDIEPMPRYPFTFVRGDALEYLAEHGVEYDAIHASPPCQRYSRTRAIPNRDPSAYPELLALTRSRLQGVGRPWILENVERAPMLSGVQLCGLAFGLRVYRHRLFESSLMLFAPPHVRHRETINTTGKKLGFYTGDDGSMVTVAGHLFSKAAGSAAMGIDWMTRDELAEAIPPAYTEYLGRQLLSALDVTEPAWVPCADGCGTFWCVVHLEHAHDCDCPAIEDWETDPYEGVTMPQRVSRWKAQHVGCQKAVDTVKADLTEEIARLRAVISDALDDLERRDEVSAVGRLRAELTTEN